MTRSCHSAGLGYSALVQASVVDHERRVSKVENGWCGRRIGIASFGRGKAIEVSLNKATSYREGRSLPLQSDLPLINLWSLFHTLQTMFL